MTWAKLDDRANEHRKLLAAGAEACWLWSCGLMYANRQRERDGFIPEPMVPMLYPFRAPKKLVSKLVEVGLWEPAPGGFVIHDFNYWNQSREQREAELAAGRERAAKSYANRVSKKEVSSPEDSTKNPEVFENSSPILPDPTPTPLPTPTPTPKDPSGLRGEAPPAPARPRPSKFVPKSWEPEPGLALIAAEYSVDYQFELEKFRDSEHKTPKTDWDRAARNWMKSEYTRKLPGVRPKPNQGSLIQLDRLQRIANMGDE